MFSLGIVLHKMLFQRSPFVDDDDAASDEAVKLHVTVQSLRKLSESNQHDICYVTVHVMHAHEHCN